MTTAPPPVRRPRPVGLAADAAAPRSEPGRNLLSRPARPPRSVPMSHRGRTRGRDAATLLRRSAPLLAIGAVIVGALSLVVALFVSAGEATSVPGPIVEYQAQVQGTQPVAGVSVPAAAAPAPAAIAPTRVPDAATARPVAGGWTPQIGVDIANRALHWLNWPYSWDAGDANGPTLGRAVDHDSRNDAHVVGFDCSGLVIYAVAPWLRVDHSAAAQYVEAGTFHPSFAQLMPGDLLFWTRDGTVKGVGHVAIYIGHGDVVQAPESGDLIKITPVGEVEAGVIGTTRPLTA